MFRYSLIILMLISFACLLLTGFLKFPELQILLGLYNYPLPWRIISYAHDYSGAALAVLIIIHLCLNRRWFVERTKIIFSKR